ncbi:hypothetical protein A9Q78_10520 [Methylophaga sp. 41_12_T18]|nr:hypothetical protein A9Q78_10520 [Methylophaga sp. 41_12_T18]
MKKKCSAYSQSNVNYTAIDPSKASKWKGKSSARDVSIIELKVGKLLEACGYKRSVQYIPRLYSHNVFFRVWIFLEHSVLYIIKKASIYGWILTVQHVFSRRLPFSSLRTKIQKKIDQITNENLK